MAFLLQGFSEHLVMLTRKIIFKRGIHYSLKLCYQSLKDLVLKEIKFWKQLYWEGLSWKQHKVSPSILKCKRKKVLNREIDLKLVRGKQVKARAQWCAGASSYCLERVGYSGIYRSFKSQFLNIIVFHIYWGIIDKITISAHYGGLICTHCERTPPSG